MSELEYWNEHARTRTYCDIPASGTVGETLDIWGAIAAISDELLALKGKHD